MEAQARELKDVQLEAGGSDVRKLTLIASNRTPHPRLVRTLTLDPPHQLLIIPFIARDVIL
jgi:hypothetical protein